MSAGGLRKKRVYVDDPADAPEDATVQEGPHGGLFYETVVSTGQRIDEAVTDVAGNLGIDEYEFRAMLTRIASRFGMQVASHSFGLLARHAGTAVPRGLDVAQIMLSDDEATSNTRINADLLAKEMSIGMFAALASESPVPTVEEVDADYNDVEGETPDGDTAAKAAILDEIAEKIDELAAEGSVTPEQAENARTWLHQQSDSKMLKNDITNALVKVLKGRVYVADTSEIPDGFRPQEGPRGGIYYEVDGPSGVGGDGEVDPPTDDGGESASEAEDGPPDGGDDGGESGDADDDHTPDPDTDIPRFRESDEAANKIAATNETQEMGFTLHRDLEVQDLGDEDIWLVSMTGVVTQGELTKDDVVGVYNEYQDILTDFTGVRLGGWHFAEERGKFAVDINAAVTDAEEAEQLGKDLNQEGIFNLGTEDYIPTGGKGESPLEGPEDVRETLANIESLSEKILHALSPVVNPVTKEAETSMTDKTTTYQGESGKKRTFFQIAMLGVKEGWEIIQTDDGFVVEGELYTPVEDSNGDEE